VRFAHLHRETFCAKVSGAMAVNNSPGRQFQPGQSGNPDGRPVGAINRRDAELFARLKNRGDREAADILSEIANDKNEPTPLRIAAATALAPYEHGKRGAIPEPPALVYVATQIKLPHTHATEIRHAIENIEFLSGLRQTGQLDQASADALISDQRLVRDGLIEEQTHQPTGWPTPANDPYRGRFAAVAGHVDRHGRRVRRPRCFGPLPRGRQRRGCSRWPNRADHGRHSALPHLAAHTQAQARGRRSRLACPAKP
jgi:hypothetical protein